MTESRPPGGEGRRAWLCLRCCFLGLQGHGEGAPESRGLDLAQEEEAES